MVRRPSRPDAIYLSEERARVHPAYQETPLRPADSALVHRVLREKIGPLSMSKVPERSDVMIERGKEAVISDWSTVG